MDNRTREKTGALDVDREFLPEHEARIWFGGHNQASKRTVAPLLAGSAKPQGGSIDAAYLTPETVDEAVYFASKVAARLKPQGRLWVVLPVLSAGGTDEIAGDRSSVSREIANLGFTERQTARVGPDFEAVGFLKT